MKGSCTVEAAMVFPWILFSVIFIWYLGFFQHNKAVCQAICREAVYVCLEAKNCRKDVESAMQKVLEEQTAWLPGNPDTDTNAEVEGSKLYAKIDMTMEFPFAFFNKTKLGGTWEITGEASLWAEYPVKEIRVLRKIEKLNDALQREDERGAYSDDGGI